VPVGTERHSKPRLVAYISLMCRRSTYKLTWGEIVGSTGSRSIGRPSTRARGALPENIHHVTLVRKESPFHLLVGIRVSCVVVADQVEQGAIGDRSFAFFYSIFLQRMSPVLAQSGRAARRMSRQLLGAKRTPRSGSTAAANDPKRTSTKLRQAATILVLSPEANMKRRGKTMKATLLILTFMFSLAAPPLRAETIDVSDNHGGSVAQYDAHWAELAQRGVSVRIVGPCQSACTVLLGHIPRSKICVTPDASFGFHLAHLPQATTILWNSYPSGIKAWITAHGGLTHDFIWMRAPDTYSFFAKC
jgi:hypothetical protein